MQQCQLTLSRCIVLLRACVMRCDVRVVTDERQNAAYVTALYDEEDSDGRDGVPVTDMYSKELTRVVRPRGKLQRE